MARPHYAFERGIILEEGNVFMVNMCKYIQLQKHGIATTNLTYVSIRQPSRFVLDNHVLLIYCFMYLIVFVGILCWSLFCYALLCVLSSVAVIWTRKREIVALL